MLFNGRREATGVFESHDSSGDVTRLRLGEGGKLLALEQDGGELLLLADDRSEKRESIMSTMASSPDELLQSSWASDFRGDCKRDDVIVRASVFAHVGLPPSQYCSAASQQ